MYRKDMMENDKVVTQKNEVGKKSTESINSRKLSRIYLFIYF